jgi:hypothetical protein
MFNSKMLSKEILLEHISSNNLNIDILNNKNLDEKSSQLMVKTHDFESMHALGSPTWCVAYNENYFKQYMNSCDSMVIYFNFDLPVSHPFFRIGFVLKKNFTIYLIHLNNGDNFEDLKSVVFYKKTYKIKNNGIQFLDTFVA